MARSTAAPGSAAPGVGTDEAPPPGEAGRDDAEPDEAARAELPVLGAPPGLVLVATPIGNMGDLSPRALAALRGADAVLCEDTRVTGPMLSRQGVRAALVSLHDHNEGAAALGLVQRMRGGERFALVSDAGTPLVSDPGYRLVRAAIEAGVAITAVPGPNAALAALTLSGLPPHPFLFGGFLPPREAARRAEVARLAAAERAGLRATLVFFEAPHRLGAMLAGLAEGFGPRPAAVARELTKLFEEVRRGTLVELAAHYAAHAARGEVVVVVGPAPEEAAPAEGELDARLRAALAGGASLRDAAAMVAAATGLPRREVYNRALALGGEG